MFNRVLREGISVLNGLLLVEAVFGHLGKQVYSKKSSTITLTRSHEATGITVFRITTYHYDPDDHSHDRCSCTTGAGLTRDRRSSPFRSACGQESSFRKMQNGASRKRMSSQVQAQTHRSLSFGHAMDLNSCQRRKAPRLRTATALVTRP